MADLDAALIALIEDLNRQRAASPHDAVVARQWSSLALRMGQYQKVRRCAARFYTQETDPIRLAEWSRLGGQAAFRQIKLDEALAAFAVSLMHLTEIGGRGQLPAATPQANKDNHFKSEAAEQLLWTTSAALARNGLAVFPFAGTLLGLVRNGQLLPFDKDIDLGIWCEDFDDCCHWLASQGWQPIPGLPPYTTFRAFLDPPSGLTLDIMSFLRMPAELNIIGGFQLEGYSQHYQSWRHYPWFELEKRRSPAGDVWCIKDPEAILEAIYGDWRRPNPWWDGMISSLAMTEFTLLIRCYAYDRLLMRWLSGQPERAWAYAHQILLKDPKDFPAIRAKQCLGKVLDSINPDALNWPPTSTRTVLS